MALHIKTTSGEVRRPPHAEVSPQSLLLLLALDILHLEDAVGNAIGPGQKILAGAIEGSSTGTLRWKSKSALYPRVFVYI
jgi:hypothetical protein